jgi:aryl-alcohol dehydrogenase-like predicted oxidoreductase
MQQRNLGEFRVGAIGLGAMPMSIEGRPDAERSIRTIHAALDAGVSLIDTADAYYVAGEEPGHNELLVARALRDYPERDQVLVATKGGHYRSPDGGWPVDGRPEHLLACAEASRQRLGLEVIGLYQLHRPDPNVAYAESLGALRQLLDTGVIRYAGISNADLEQIELARQILGPRLVSVQNQLSPAFRDSLPELRRCAELELAFLPWRPLGGLTYERDDAAVRPFAQLAAVHEVSVAVVILAWLLAQGRHVIPIPGSTRPETILDSISAADLVLTGAEVAWLDGTGPAPDGVSE